LQRRQAASAQQRYNLAPFTRCIGLGCAALRVRTASAFPQPAVGRLANPFFNLALIAISRACTRPGTPAKGFTPPGEKAQYSKTRSRNTPVEKHYN